MPRLKSSQHAVVVIGFDVRVPQIAFLTVGTSVGVELDLLKGCCSVYVEKETKRNIRLESFACNLCEEGQRFKNRSTFHSGILLSVLEFSSDGILIQN